MTLLSGTIGNAFLFYVVGVLKKKRNSEDVYVLSLASADFMTSLAADVEYILLETKSFRHCGKSCSKSFYLIAGCFTHATIYASAWNLVLISLNRYR